jgi:hypothetical protein
VLGDSDLRGLILVQVLEAPLHACADCGAEGLTGQDIMSLVVIAGVFLNHSRGPKLLKLLVEIKVDGINLRLSLLLSLGLLLFAFLLDVIPQANLALEVV